MRVKDESQRWIRVVGGIWGECWTVGAHQGSVLSPLTFAIVVDVVTEDA